MGFFLRKREVSLGIKCGFPFPIEVFKKVVKKVFKTVRTNRCDFETSLRKDLHFDVKQICNTSTLFSTSTENDNSQTLFKFYQGKHQPLFFRPKPVPVYLHALKRHLIIT